MESIPARIQAYLAHKKLSANKFATMLGYDSSEKIRRLFRGENANPSAEILQDIANKFAEINIEWVLTGKGEMIKTPSKEGNTPSDLIDNHDDISVMEASALYQKGQKLHEKLHPTLHPTPKTGANSVLLGRMNEPQNQVIYNFGVPRVVTINENREENIIYVPVKARAGYLTGYGDTDFIQTLPTLRLPGLNNGTYRMFEVEGPSMAPNITSGDRVIGQWVNSMNEIRENRVHVLVTKDGVVVKRVLNRIAERGKIVLKSDTINHRREYPSYEVNPEDVFEIWYGRMKLSSDFSEPAEVYHRVADLEADMVNVKAILSQLKPL